MILLKSTVYQPVLSWALVDPFSHSIIILTLSRAIWDQYFRRKTHESSALKSSRSKTLTPETVSKEVSAGAKMFPLKDLFFEISFLTNMYNYSNYFYRLGVRIVMIVGY